ncbi:unnamed protein product, partial [marine sediment metagenome]
LDFGIYRIMKYEKEEIEKFIEKDLIEKTKIQLNLLSMKNLYTSHCIDNPHSALC